MPDEVAPRSPPSDDASSPSDLGPLPPAKTKERIRIKLPVQSQVFFFLLLALLLFLTWLVFKGFIIYMVTGVFVAVLALPIDKLWERVFPNRLAAIATILTLIMILTIPMAAIGWSLYKDSQVLTEALNEGSLRDYANRSVDLLYPGQVDAERNQTVNNIVNETQDYLQQALSNLAQQLLDGVWRFFLAFTVILFVVYYVLADGHRLMGYLRRATPLPPKQVDYLAKEAHRGLRAVFVGQMLTSIIQGVIGGIGFLIVGLPGVILWSAVMAIFSLLPVVGAFLVWLPAGVFLLIKGEIWKGIFMLAWGAIVVSQVDNFVRPRLIGNRADIHPLFVLIGVLGGVAAFGFIGLFLGPVLVGVTISVLKVWETDYRDPRTLELRIDTESEPEASPPAPPT